MINVLISADSKYPISRPLIKKAVENVLASRNVTSMAEVSVLVCGTRKAREIAKKYLNDSEAHNVLSFPLSSSNEKYVYPSAKSATGFIRAHEGVIVLGDIIVCYPMAQEEANDDNMLVNEKICELVSHGMLHLLGEHHEE